MRVHELLASKQDSRLICARPTASTLELAETLTNHCIGALLITDEENNLLGLVSERDLIRTYAASQGGLMAYQAGDIMTQNVISSGENDDVSDTLSLMTEKHIRHMPVLRDGKPLAMLSIREIEIAYRSLQVDARTDELTSLPNRRSFLETLREEFSRSQRFEQPLSIAMIDLDHFKQVNDSHGHAAGDAVLCAVGRLLVRELRTYDRIGRLGGEEFAVLFPHASISAAEQACARLKVALSLEDVPWEDKFIRVSASFGVTEVTAYDVSGEAALRRADNLLYKAKEGGRNRVEVDAC